jgi:hypothetical protein
MKARASSLLTSCHPSSVMLVFVVDAAFGFACEALALANEYKATVISMTIKVMA